MYSSQYILLDYKILVLFSVFGLLCISVNCRLTDGDAKSSLFSRDVVDSHWYGRIDFSTYLHIGLDPDTLPKMLTKF